MSRKSKSKLKQKSKSNNDYDIIALGIIIFIIGCFIFCVYDYHFNRIPITKTQPYEYQFSSAMGTSTNLRIHAVSSDEFDIWMCNSTNSCELIVTAFSYTYKYDSTIYNNDKFVLKFSPTHVINSTIHITLNEKISLFFTSSPKFIHLSSKQNICHISSIQSDNYTKSIYDLHAKSASNMNIDIYRNNILYDKFNTSEIVWSYQSNFYYDENITCVICAIDDWQILEFYEKYNYYPMYYDDDDDIWMWDDDDDE